MLSYFWSLKLVKKVKNPKFVKEASGILSSLGINIPFINKNPKNWSYF